jgi:hypothetical protein
MPLKIVSEVEKVANCPPYLQCFQVQRYLFNISKLNNAIYILKCINTYWVRLLSNYNIKYICTIYTRLYTCLMSISRFPLRDKVTLRLLKLYLIADVDKWSCGLDIRLQCINGVSSNPVEARTKMCRLKDLMLTLLGLIFRRVYIYMCWEFLDLHHKHHIELFIFTFFT